MMNPPKTKFNAWIIRKIAAFLETKEGCQIQEQTYTQDGAKTSFVDSFGFKYEIHIKTIGRINSDPNDMEVYENTGDNYDFVVVSQNKSVV